MRRIVGTLLLVAVAAGAALGLSACGGDDAEATGGTTDAAATMTQAAAAGAAADLRVALDRLLGEHAMLAVVAMQKGHDGAPDFEQAAGALEANTVALGDAIGSVYGDEAKAGFLRLWRQHIGFFVDYTVATAGDDEAGRRAALQKLDGYRQAFAQFMASANPELEASAVADLLQTHVGQLTAALNAYAAGERAEAYRQVREAYAHMFMTGDALAGAIAAQFPETYGR